VRQATRGGSARVRGGERARGLRGQTNRYRKRGEKGAGPGPSREPSRATKPGSWLWFERVRGGSREAWAGSCESRQREWSEGGL
jgi:hypothetical protein